MAPCSDHLSQFEWHLLCQQAVENGLFSNIFSQPTLPDFPPALRDHLHEMKQMTSLLSPHEDVAGPSSFFTPLSKTENLTTPSQNESLLLSESQSSRFPSHAESRSRSPITLSSPPPPSTLVHRTPKRYIHRAQPKQNFLDALFTAESVRPNEYLRQCLNRIRVASFYLQGEHEPTQNTPDGLAILQTTPPSSSRSAKSDPSIYRIFLDGTLCLMCGEEKKSVPRAAGCVRKHLDHRPFRCRGQLDGCANCSNGNEYVFHDYFEDKHQSRAFSTQFLLVLLN